MNQRDLGRIALIFALCLSVGLGSFYFGRLRSQTPVETAATPTPKLAPTAKPTQPKVAPIATPTPIVAGQMTRAEVGASLNKLSSDNMIAHVRYLSVNIGPRLTGTTAEKRAADYIEDQFGKFGYAPERQNFTSKRGKKSCNIVAVRPSPNKDAPSIVIGAHYDSVRGAPGANDNASGVAVLLEVARQLAQENPAFNVTFVAFGSEEGGHDGSLRYASLVKKGDVERPNGMINMDMVGVGSVYAIGRWKNTDLWLMKHCGGASVRWKCGAKIGSTFGGKSDYASFSDIGVPVAGFAWDDDPNYHSERDSLKNNDLTAFSFRLKQTARTMLAAFLTPKGGFADVMPEVERQVKNGGKS